MALATPRKSKKTKNVIGTKRAYRKHQATFNSGREDMVIEVLSDIICECLDLDASKIDSEEEHSATRRNYKRTIEIAREYRKMKELENVITTIK